MKTVMSGSLLTAVHGTAAVLTLIGFGGLGAALGGRRRGRRRMLEMMVHALVVLEGEISYRQTPLWEAMHRIALQTEGESASFFHRISQRMGEHRGESFGKIWLEEIQRLRMEGSLLKQDGRELDHLGDSLGYLDAISQIRNLELCRNRLEREISDLNKREREQCRLYLGLCLTVGGLLILLIY